MLFRKIVTSFIALAGICTTIFFGYGNINKTYIQTIPKNSLGCELDCGTTYHYTKGILTPNERLMGMAGGAFLTVTMLGIFLVSIKSASKLKAHF